MLLFQSTPPSREATKSGTRFCSYFQFQSTPPSREATSIVDLLLKLVVISIHASLAGGDFSGLNTGSAHGKFQSTPPSREAT